jgi:hypothetical protein
MKPYNQAMNNNPSYQKIVQSNVVIRVVFRVHIHVRIGVGVGVSGVGVAR